MALLEDSKFYGFAANIAETCQALSKSSSPATVEALIKLVTNPPYERNPRTEHIPPDPILLELESIMRREFFSSSFVYQPLDGQNSIRILVLHPGSRCDPLRGTVEHIDVTAGRRYEAISYTWGDDSMPCSIIIDGFRMSLTQSLYNALVRLRYPNSHRKLWADGLCINQEDNKEKGIQVALMPKIYTYAAKVLVHLGLEADGSELLPELLEKLGTAESARIRDRDMLPEEFLSNGLPPPDDVAWEALIAFICRPWFLRVWIIQEVVLARDIRFFCGDWELGWGILAELAERFECIHNSICKHLHWKHNVLTAQHAAMSLGLVLAFRLTRSSVAERLEFLRRDVESIASSTRETSHIESLTQEVAAKRELVVQACREHRELYQALERSILAFDAVKPSSTPILKLLGIFPHNEATKPQDRLYALIGLAGDITLEDFPPDYEETENQTNARFARKMVEKGQGMHLLYHATRIFTQTWNLSLPSWAPDWTPRRSMHSHWLKLGWAYSQSSGGYNGCPNSASNLSLVDGAPNVLRATGFRVDFLGSVVKLYDDIREFKASTFHAASKTFFPRAEAATNDAFYFTGETWREALCRTLVAGRMETRGESSSAALQQYEEAKSIFMNPPQNLQNRSKNSWIKAWLGLMPEYSFCKTSRGYIGLVPQATDSTDVVFMFQGSDLPFVLRPMPTIPGLYRFVGGCYMHGLMKGQAWKLKHTSSEVFLF